ncbi:MAG: GNAT family N-acetyltransferase [Acidobacteriota bacterium]
MTKKTDLRPVGDDDWEFLYRVYADTREEELRQVPWSREEKDAFLRFQFDAQRKYYAEVFTAADYYVVEVGGERAGRLYLDRRDDEIRLIDIALLSRFRGQGLGGELMADVLAEGKRKGLLVRIHVEQNNPALRLYKRLGFQKIEEQGVYWLMEWVPKSRETTDVG